MLQQLSVRGFKSLRDVDVDLAPFTVLFGPNAAGKSNFLDAVHFLSAAVNRRTLQEAFEGSVRGYPVEAFTFPRDGVSGLLARGRSELELDARIEAPDRNESASLGLRYRLRVGIQPRSGHLTVEDELLQALSRAGEPKGEPRIQHDEGKVLVRKRKVGRPQQEPSGENHTVASVPAFTGEYYPEIDGLKAETGLWRSYYLDPRTAMREPKPPAEVDDIGLNGALLSAFLFRLQNTPDLRKYFSAIIRLVRQIVPSVDDLDVKLDEQRAQIDLWVRQDGVSYSNRVISEGTLRVIALAAIALNPTPARLIAFEEPENGVHPQRLAHVANILAYAAGLDQEETRSQVIVNTHSPLFVAEALKLKREHPERVSIIHVSHEGGGSRFSPMPDPGELFQGGEVEELLRTDEEAKLSSLLLRGLLDG